MHLLRVKKLTNLLESIHEDVLYNLRLAIGKTYKYLDNKLKIVEADSLDMIVVEIETIDGDKFNEFLNFQELKYYIDKLEEL